MRGSATLTPATTALLVANGAVFIAMLAYGASFWGGSGEVPLQWGANFGPATKDGQWWRLATAMFVHFGVVHLAMNLWALRDSGRLVERLFGSARFLAIYLASGVAGNLVSLVSQGDAAVSGGASGAIFGLFGALLVLLVRERRQVDPVEFRWLFWGGAAFALASLGLGFVVQGIDNAAHIGGLASGALLGLALARPIVAGATAPARWPRLVAAATFTLAALAIAFNVPQPRYRFDEERQARTAIRQFLQDEQRIAGRLQAIEALGRKGTESFDELAGRIDADVSKEYQDSFEALAALSISPAAPSAASLDVLRKYALLRGDAAHALAEALRANDPEAVRRALEAMREAPQLARAASAAASAQPADGAASAVARRLPSRRR